MYEFNVSRYSQEYNYNAHSMDDMSDAEYDEYMRRLDKSSKLIVRMLLIFLFLVGCIFLKGVL